MKNQLKLLFTLVSITIFNGLLFAQNSIGGDSNVAPDAEKVQKVAEVSAFSFILKGGFFLIPIVILLFYTLYVIIERTLYIRRMTKFDNKLMDTVRPHMAKGTFKEALSAIQSNETAFGSVLKEGISSVDLDAKQAQVESNMDKVANIEIGKMEKNLGHLGLIAGIAPTIGFIGTISGVITVFYDISKTENVSIGIISEGLYEKMFSSAAGLIVGLIAYAGYHILNSVIDSNTLRMQQVIVKFTKLTRP